MGMAGVPSAMLFVRSDAGGVSHAPEETTGADAVELVRARAGAGAAGAGGRMTDWDRLARPSLRGLERYDPGDTRDELKERHGLAELEPLNWNEDLFGPPQEALDAAAAELRTARRSTRSGRSPTSATRWPAGSACRRRW